MMSKPKARDTGCLKPELLNLKKEGNLAVARGSWKEVRKIDTPFIYSTFLARASLCLKLESQKNQLMHSLIQPSREGSRRG